MNSEVTHINDARAVANFILDYADEVGLPISNLSLQKILYFAEGWHIVQFDSSLISNDFEAWQYGPVIRCVYNSFKNSKDKPIKSRAYRYDAIKNQNFLCEGNFISRQRLFLRSIVEEYGRLSAFNLVDLTHAPGSPWHKIWHHPNYSDPIGLQIPRNTIEDFFRNILGNQITLN